MLITIKTWNAIRSGFDQWEKDQINAAITGETLCPKGIVVDETVLPESVAFKLKNGKERVMRSSFR